VSWIRSKKHILPLAGGIILIASLLFFFYNYENYGTYKPGYGSNKIDEPGRLNMKTEIKDNLKRIVNILARKIGSRGYSQTDNLDRAAQYIKSELNKYGYNVLEQPYNYKGRTYKNIFVEKRGKKDAEKLIIVGAHYDTAIGTPGADDNASGVAGLLELARLLTNIPLDKTVHFVAFALEEPPLFRSRFMGSHVYAKNLKQTRRHVEGMICLEMIGYFTDEPESQLFPLPFFRWLYPTTGNFIALVSNLQSRGFLNRVKSAFKKGTSLPVESLSTVSLVPGVDFSDHRSFWKFGYDAIMVTDTAFYRNFQYHGPGDIPEILDYDRMAEVVFGLESAIRELASN
jgi:hypothetical protein